MLVTCRSVRRYGGKGVLRYLAIIITTTLLPYTAFAAPPTAPSELRVVVDTGGLRLYWKDNSENESGFEIHNGDTSRRVGAQTTFYRWGDMKPVGQYMCFRIRAYNDEGSSAWEPNVEPWYRCGTTGATGGIPPIGPKVDTGNYAGYGATGTEFQVVGGTWWVPRVECPPWFQLPWKTTRAGPWVGLAGRDLYPRIPG